MKKIVILASGNGSNAENIISYFKHSKIGQVIAVFSNKQEAKVLEKASKHNVSNNSFTKDELNNGEFLSVLNNLKPDLIVLAGFLLKFPEYIISQYPNKIINIHPSLLPKYGGKGMYGKYVHQAVFNNKETETGITIHYVNEHYDEGAIVFQKEVNIQNCTNVEEIESKVHELEHQYFPVIIERLLS